MEHGKVEDGEEKKRRKKNQEKTNERETTFKVQSKRASIYSWIVLRCKNVPLECFVPTGREDHLRDSSMNVWTCVEGP